MKKTAILVFLAILLLGGCPALACQRCERILAKGYAAGFTREEIVRIISDGNPKAQVYLGQMETRLEQAIANKGVRFRGESRVQNNPYFVVGNDKNFRYSNEVIKVPPDIEDERR
ncbi:MAG: hypothetical protein PHT44_04405 [Candidatus Portnoybacteria bacterium]|nr:hypothetical protein [Candidatus Portnoybacteria bacterium]MDD4983151.1 hypothetical protein [Candidatus Portnoybacteria bacterium]